MSFSDKWVEVLCGKVIFSRLQRNKVAELGFKLRSVLPRPWLKWLSAAFQFPVGASLPPCKQNPGNDLYKLIRSTEAILIESHAAITGSARWRCTTQAFSQGGTCNPCQKGEWTGGGSLLSWWVNGCKGIARRLWPNVLYLRLLLQRWN